jgi:hypothetical protein
MRRSEAEPNEDLYRKARPSAQKITPEQFVYGCLIGLLKLKIKLIGAQLIVSYLIEFE